MTIPPPVEGPKGPVGIGAGGLAGGRLQANVLTNVIRRTARGAGLSSTSRPTRCAIHPRLGYARRRATRGLSRSTLGHADLSTVSRYAHVASEEMHATVQTLADRAAARSASAPPSSRRDAENGPTGGMSAACTPAQADSGSESARKSLGAEPLRATATATTIRGAAWSVAGQRPGARAERFHKDRLREAGNAYPVKNPATRPIEKPRRSGAFP